jgi:hypothetical protein
MDAVLKETVDFSVILMRIQLAIKAASETAAAEQEL